MAASFLKPGKGEVFPNEKDIVILCDIIICSPPLLLLFEAKTQVTDLTYTQGMSVVSVREKNYFRNILHQNSEKILIEMKVILRQRINSTNWRNYSMVEAGSKIQNCLISISTLLTMSL